MYIIDSNSIMVNKYSYSSADLLHLKSNFLQPPSDVWKTINSLGIRSPQVKPPTHRGVKAGRRRQKQIKIVSTNRTTTRQQQKEPKKRNLHNLVDFPRQNPNHLSIHIWNAQSARNKTDQITDFLLAKDVDALFLTETWLSKTDSVIIGELTPAGYSFLNIPRLTTPLWGGIGVISKTNLNLKIKPSNFSTKTFEHVLLYDGSKRILFVVVYRPPPSDENNLKTPDYLVEIDHFISEVNMSSPKVIFIGDFNLHLDLPQKPEVRTFNNNLSAVGLKQLVQEPTHVKGHMLDLVICRSDEDIIDKLEVHRSLISDHFVINCELNLQRPKPQKVSSCVRNLKAMDSDSFKSDLLKEFEAMPSGDDINLAYNGFETALSKTLDKHAPSTVKYRTIRPHYPWYDDEIHKARQERRRLEKRWRHTRTEDDLNKFQEQSKIVTKLIQDAKVAYYKNELDDANTKKVFQTLNTLLNKGSKVLPICDSSNALSNDFAHFFKTKITTIRAKLDNVAVSHEVSISANDLTQDMDFASIPNSMRNFIPVTEDEVLDIITKLPNKSCSMDILPTWLLKSCVDTLLTPITSIINMSLQSGQFPENLKNAVVTPIIKKPSLDPNDLKNYRPVSNIKAFSKIIEKVALPQINEHLNKNNLLEPFQSGYKALHSTETALLRVKNDIMQALDRQHATFLVLLDLSAAFDTIDYPILLRRLSQSYNITGHALGWIQSYLTGRTSQVCVSGTLSNTNALECGLPQGSVVSPNLFTLYTGPMAKIIHRHKLKYHLYADDAQLYIEFDPNIPGDTAVAVFKLQACIRDLKQWMTSNKLQLNEQKTEFFMTASKHNLKLLSNITLTIGDAMIEPSPIIRNLGVVFDSQNMSMSSHVNTVSRSINFHLRNLNRIRRYIDTDTCKHATRALILSRLDYSNSLLCNSTAQNIQKLQVLQNRAARLVYRVGRREHASPLLNQLHWLPIKERILFKILLLVYKCLHNCAPVYLIDLLNHFDPPRNLRSAQDQPRLIVHRTYTNSGDSAFCNAAPRCWNALPLHIRRAETQTAFKSLLKTHIYPSYD